MSTLYNKIISYLLVALLVIGSTLLLWLPFILRQSSWAGLSIPNSNFQYVYRHFDGPLYIVPAKTLYDPKAIEALRLEQSVPPSYFAAHLPLYPFLIRLFSPVLGFLKSTIAISLLFSILLAVFFNFFVKNLKLTQKPFLLTAVFLFLPRLFVVRSVGAPETLFMLLILASLYFFEKKNYVAAGLLGAFSVATKTPGMLLFIAYALIAVKTFWQDKKIPWRMWGIGIIPLGLIGVFSLYAVNYGDFFAYFKSGDNIHLTHPFAAFNFRKMWIATAWLEDIVFYFLLYAITVVTLWDKKKYQSLTYFATVFFLAILFVEHRDIARYSLPLWPLACIAFSEFFTSKRFLTAFLLVLPAIYLYALNFMTYNIMPISDWRPFL